MNAWITACMMTAAAGHGASPVYDVAFAADVPYLGSARRECLDLYRPVPRSPDERFPGVVIIHGGGWSGGTKSAGREINIGTNLARLGYVCISIDYLLSTPQRPSWPENVYDCKRAVQFLRVNARDYQLDPAHIGCIGGSAGGHLSAFLATAGAAAGLEPPTPYPGVSSQVQAGIDLYGIADVPNWRRTAADGTPLEIREHSSSTWMLGATYEDDPELWERASPLHQANASAPPIFILHGMVDTVVDRQQALTFHARLTELGVDAELLMLDGIGHTFDLQRWGSRTLPGDVRRRVVGFFDRHLMGLTQTIADARFQAYLAWEATHPEAAYAGTWSFGGVPVLVPSHDGGPVSVQHNGVPLQVHVCSFSRCVLQKACTLDDLADGTGVTVKGKAAADGGSFAASALTAFAPGTSFSSMRSDTLLRGRLVVDATGLHIHVGKQRVALHPDAGATVARRAEVPWNDMAAGDRILYASCRRLGALVLVDRAVFVKGVERGRL